MLIVMDGNVSYCISLSELLIQKPYLFGFYATKSQHATLLSHAATLSGDKVARQSCATKSQV